MPAYPHIESYYAALRELIDYGGSDSELNIRPAFQNCLAAYCGDHKERLALVPEVPVPSGVVPDGTVKDTLRMARGYWEAKDSHDDLDEEITRKFDRGYPRDNIIFEDSRTAVLVQNREEAMRADMTSAGDLHRLIRRFLDYELPQIEEFRDAQEQFKADLPAVLENLREAVEEAGAENRDYVAAAAGFLELCRQSISPDVSADDVREMLLQHILTKDIFLRVFAEDQFHRENDIAQRLDVLEQTFFTGDVRRQAIDRLRTYYGAIGRAADDIADYGEKQGFLKAIYEDFYKAYNPAAADRLGVVYTPNEVVDFMVRGADHLLQKHFGRGLADDNVQILDPATGTGTFVTSLIDYLPLDRLEYKYLNEIHANEVAILPYYIANLNIEYTYKERTGRFLQFPNLCFVDTLDNLGWQQQRAEAAREGEVTVTARQSTFNLGGLSTENWIRVQEQNEKTISVIIGNPPYNANQRNFNEFNPNVVYPEVDRRISETYVAESDATKTKQYDMYKRFIRWASDRLADDGIIAFVTNRAYVDARQDDGFRKMASKEFTHIYVLDLGSDVRRNPKISGTTHNVFGIQTGVAIGFFVRDKANLGKCDINYTRRKDAELAFDTLAFLRGARLDQIAFDEVTPDQKGNWLDQSNPDFEKLMPLANGETELVEDSGAGGAVFGLFSLGVSTNRDEGVYDFDVHSLRDKALFFADTYNEYLDDENTSYDPVIKWSRDLRNEFRRGRRIVYNEANLIQTLYRPFVTKRHFADFTMNDVLTNKHYSVYGDDLAQPNRAICFSGIASQKPFTALATSFLCSLDSLEKTQCLPLYRYMPEGERVSNITEWGIRRINDHYREEWGDDFTEKYPDGIGAEDIFAYTYAVLHDPVYRYDYASDLLREFPRLPLYHEFDIWARMGQQLLDLHIGFESVDPYPLERVEKSPPARSSSIRETSATGYAATGRAPSSPATGKGRRSSPSPSTGEGRGEGEPEDDPPRARLRADKERGIIVLDDQTSLTGVPPDAWRYRLGNRSALEWVLDQYKEKKPRDPTIRARFDTYRFADHKERVIDLLTRVCAVSVSTMEIVDGMAYWEDGYLVVFGDRDKHEWSMMGVEAMFREPEDEEWLKQWLEM